MAFKKKEDFTKDAVYRNAKEAIRGVESSLEMALDPTLFEFCVWYLETKKGAAVKAVSYLRDVFIKENEAKKIVLQFENYTKAAMAHRHIFSELIAYFKGKLVCFDFDKWDVRPACQFTMSEISKRLRKSFSYQAPCMCYTCMTVRGESPKIESDYDNS